jgi:hypothetical protein
MPAIDAPVLLGLQLASEATQANPFLVQPNDHRQAACPDP